MDSIRNTFIQMAILPVPENTNLLIKIRNNSFGAFLFSITFALVLASAAYFVVFLGVKLESSLFSVMQVALFLPVAYSISVGFLKGQEMKKLFVEFENVQEKCKSQGSLFIRPVLWKNKNFLFQTHQNSLTKRIAKVTQF